MKYLSLSCLIFLLLLAACKKEQPCECFVPKCNKDSVLLRDTIYLPDTTVLGACFLWVLRNPNSDSASMSFKTLVNVSNQQAYEQSDVLWLAKRTSQGEFCDSVAYVQNTDTTSLKVFPQVNCYVPNAFTPNGDGINETIKPLLVGNIYADYSFSIYNRWGEVMFETNDINAAWDGRFNGELMKADVYACQVRAKFFAKTDSLIYDGEKRSMVNLIR